VELTIKTNMSVVSVPEDLYYDKESLAKGVLTARERENKNLPRKEESSLRPQKAKAK